jgi:hypothetical protein
MVDLTYTDEELNRYGKGNYVVFQLLPLRFLSEQNFSIKDYAHFIGNTLSVTWKNFLDAPMDAKAKLIAINYAACGADKMSFEASENELEIRIDNWPHPGLLQTLKVTKDMVTEFNYVWEPIGKFLGLEFKQEATEKGYILKFTKK